MVSVQCGLLGALAHGQFFLADSTATPPPRKLTEAAIMMQKIVDWWAMLREGKAARQEPRPPEPYVLESVQRAEFGIHVCHQRFMGQRLARHLLDQIGGEITAAMRMDGVVEPLLQTAEFAA